MLGENSDEAVQPIRGVQFGWNSFLWNFLNALARLIADDNYVGALKLLHTYCRFLPVDMKERMQEDITRLENYVRVIRKAKVTVASAAPNGTVFQTALASERMYVLLNARIAEFVESFTDKLVSLLDEKGYLERRQREVSTGKGPTLFSMPGFPK